MESTQQLDEGNLLYTWSQSSMLELECLARRLVNSPTGWLQLDCYGPNVESIGEAAREHASNLARVIAARD